MTIGTIEIYAAFRALLEANFLEIPVQIKDIKHPKPPCFYIQYPNKTENQTAQSYKTDSCIFNILYFSENEELLELLEVQEKLERLFEKPLKGIKGDKTLWIELGQLSFNLNEDDYILTCSINIDSTQYFKSDEYKEVETEEGEDETVEVLENRYGEIINTELMEDIEL